VRTVMSEMGMAMMGSGSSRGEERAREAAEAAMASPLLEDVNLAGARGILINVTAGLNMSIGEFEEVGGAIKEFASDDATVVVGTVIDDTMTDELRVTVVATGLGQHGVGLNMPAAEQIMAEKNISLVQKNSDGEVDYGRLDRPTVIRNQLTAEQRLQQADGDMDYLDVPAFLRRQAD